MGSMSARPPLGAFPLVVTAFRVFVAQFGFLFPLAFAASLAIGGLDLAFGPEVVVAPGPDVGFVELVGGAQGLTVGVALTVLEIAIGGVLCLAALDAMIGKRHALSEYVAQTLRHLFPVVAISLLLGVATVVAATFLLIPALYVVARYLPWLPAALFENLGWAGLGRAQDLTRDYRWPLVGSIVVVGLAIAAFYAAMTPIAALISGNVITALLVDGFLSALILCIFSTFTAAAYLRLREIKEGASLADVAATID